MHTNIMPENVSYFVQYMCKICASPHNSLYLEGCKKENIPIFKFRYLGKHQRKSDIYPPSCGFRDIGLLFLLSRKIYLGLVIKHSNEKRSDERKIKKMLLICFSFIFYSLLNSASMFLHKLHTFRVSKCLGSAKHIFSKEMKFE